MRMHEKTLSSDVVHSLILLNLDQFKLINDSCGHLAGDQMLREISGVLADRIRSRDTLARTGGDEFAIILENCDLTKAIEVAQSIRYAIDQFRFQWNQRSYRVNASIGLVPISGQQKSPSDIMRDAVAALFTAKDTGRNKIHVSDENDLAVTQRREQMKWAGKITEALENNRFNIYAQPIHKIGNESKNGTYVEILLRLTDDDDQIITAGEFLPAAESYGLMPLIDRWVIRKTFAWLAEDALGQVEHCAINLSGASLGSEGFMRFVHEQFDMYRISPSRLVFEITESSLIENISAAREFINEFKQHGCRFALDDFGKGLSSFGYLKNLKVDILKIDGMFVRDMIDDEIDNTLVRAINNIGHNLGKETVAEFVENDTILSALTEIGVDYVQGYALGMPAAITPRTTMKVSDSIIPRARVSTGIQ
jgi:diguanylate cyclase (GGDEF)-like protein